MSQSIGALRPLVNTAEGEISREIFVNKEIYEFPKVVTPHG